MSHDHSICKWLEELDRKEGATYRYYLSAVGFPEREVSKEEWVVAERLAGFRNTLGHPDEPATASFSAGNMSGRFVRVVGEEPQ